MTLRARVLVVVALATALLGGAAYATFDTLADERAARTEVRARVQPASDAARDLLGDLVDQETGVRGFVLTGRDDFLEPYEAGRRRTRAALAEIAGLTAGDGPIAASVREVRRLQATWQIDGAEPEIRARRRGDVARAQALVNTGRAKGLFDRLRAEVDVLQSMLERRVATANVRSQEAASQLVAQLTGIAALLVVLAVASLLLARRWILDPLGRLRFAMRAVSDGDLSRSVDPGGPPEIVALGRDAEAMRRRILDELEASEGARQALESEGAVSLGLRRQLDSAPRTPDGLVLAGELHAAEGILAGDWWDVVALPSGDAALVLADVSGHGAGAGLVAVRLKHVLTAGLRAGLRPGAALRMAAEELGDDPERFATCVVVRIDARLGGLSWANAGHPPPLVRSPSGTLAELGVTGPLLSGMGGDWAERERTLGPGELLVAFTDGLTEARREGDALGEDGVRAVLLGLTDPSPRAAVDACLAAARAHAREQRRDDITVVALQRA